MARIRHLAILTEDVEGLVSFYTNSFGLEPVEGEGTATYLTDGHINLAIIPIGAYGPRYFTLNQHLDPAQVVLVHQEIRSQKSITIHWGTF